MFEIAKLIIAALAGGGLWQVVTWKLRRRKLANDTATADYRRIEEIIDSYITRMSKMSDTIIELEQENLTLRRQLLVRLNNTEEDGHTAK